MLYNYIKSALRNIRKNLFFSVINILGLTTGMTICLLIFQYVNYEKGYDKFYKNGDRIYRLRYERSDMGGESARFASCCPPAGLRIRDKFAEVENTGRMFKYMASVSYNENKFFEERMFFAEYQLLEILKLDFTSGLGSVALKQPGNAVISETTAKKYFGNMNPLGQTISVDKKTNFKIAGVFKDNPHNSHVKFDILLSYKNLLSIFGEDVENSWGDTGWYTYILLKPNTDVNALQKKLPAIIDAEFAGVLKKYNLTMELVLQPLNDIHLKSHYMQEFEVNGDSDAVKYLGFIAVLIIIIAWVNYVNHSTARSLTRAKEVGIRKTAGAGRLQLMAQFFIETIIINLISVLFTFLFLVLLIKPFSLLISVPAEYSVFISAWFWTAIVLMFLFGVVISGLYPVLILTSFNPADVLRGKPGVTAKKYNLRKTLVIIQFVCAFGLLTFTITVYQQISFMKSKDPGFTVGQKLIVRMPRVRDAAFARKVDAFKNTLLAQPDIKNFCIATEFPGRQILWDAGGIVRVGAEDNKNYQIIGVDYNFIDMFKIPVAYGRNFSKDFPSDTAALILNETSVKWLGFKDARSAVGGKVSYWGQIFTVIGVLKDYHQQSAKQKFEPHILRLMPYGRGVRGYFAFELASENSKNAVTGIKKNFAEFFPENPFEYFFLDDYYNQQYKSDELLGKVFGIFSFLAIFVTSLGILGLISFMVVQRTKEIGIRKALGASIINILYLLSKDFLILIGLSFIIALPFSVLSIQSWLQTFAVRIELNPLIFIIPLFLVFLGTLISISVHIIKAALANPVKSLRYE